jgi:protein gp37
MAESTISWTDYTWSPWYGCTQVSMGPQGACEHCYARNHSEFRFHRVVFGGPGRGEGTRDVRADSAWREPLRWEREAAASKRAWFAPEGAPGGGTGKPWPYSPFVFPSMCDPFDNHPDLADPRCRFFDLIRATPNLTWLLLTKRPGNIVKLFTEAAMIGSPEGGRCVLVETWPRNAAIGFTAVTQAEMDRDSRHALAAFHALNPAFLFWSGEPLLGPIVVPPELLALGGRFQAITGGETDQGKHKARETPVEWFRDIRDQCLPAGVVYHHKQMTRGGPIPDDLRIQERPEIHA